MKDKGLDNEGHIRTDVSLSKITERFAPLVKTVQDEVVNAFEQKLHSVYIYGSVARGNAVPLTSDLDILIVYTNDLSPQCRASIAQLERDLSERFRADLREVGLVATSLLEIFDGDNQVGWGCFIKHMCACLTGEDLGTRFPAFKPTRAVGYGLNGDLSQEIEKSRLEMLKTSATTQSRAIKSIARKMVRSAFCIVIEETNCWTTNLTECSRIFSTCYPEHQTEIQYILEISNGAPVNCDEFLDILNGFGQWLCLEVERKLRPPSSTTHTHSA